MEIRNTIDVQQLEITPQDADNTYLGIDENGQLVRTKIELSGTGGGDTNFKTINGESIIGEGDIELLTMSSYNFLKGGIDANTEKINDIEDDIDNIYTKTEIGDIINSYYTKTEIDDMIGDINNILETI